MSSFCDKDKPRHGLKNYLVIGNAKDIDREKFGPHEQKNLENLDKNLGFWYSLDCDVDLLYSGTTSQDIDVRFSQHLFSNSILNKFKPGTLELCGHIKYPEKLVLSIKDLNPSESGQLLAMEEICWRAAEQGIIIWGFGPWAESPVSYQVKFPWPDNPGNLKPWFMEKDPERTKELIKLLEERKKARMADAVTWVDKTKS